jgi:hypothetical protein
MILGLRRGLLAKKNLDLRGGAVRLNKLPLFVKVRWSFVNCGRDWPVDGKAIIVTLRPDIIANQRTKIGEL